MEPLSHQQILHVNSYIKSFFDDLNNNKTIGVARAGNVIGGGDWSIR